MPTREEIREGVAEVARDTWYKRDYDQVWEAISREVIDYLHSQGVVIKVDGEIPRKVELTGNMFGYLAEGELSDCGFFEPLIEEE